ncbi:MAG: beta-lactamase family protein, partial [Oscillospiraceae bacterium]|nr:beta-lactamase family protein [Oscillospiraceae bacterium]
MKDKNLKIDDLVREAHEKGAFTGTWLYAEHGEIVSKGAVGFSDLEDKVPLREDSLFDLASVSKQFTAAAVMLLRRRGLLSLEDEITKYFPEIPYKGVTLRHLLNHTGGLPDYMDWVDETAKKENTIPGNDVIVRFLCECGEEAVFAPGEQWEYSNTGYCLLAQIVETVAGVPFEDFLRDNIFEPAGMHATRVYHRRKDKVT